MGKWLCWAYVGVLVLDVLMDHSWSWFFALRAAFWIFIGGSVVLTLFAYLCAKASIPRPARAYLGEDGNIKMPIAITALTWSAYGVLIVGSALILFGVFSKSF